MATALHVVPGSHFSPLETFLLKSGLQMRGWRSSRSLLSSARWGKCHKTEKPTDKRDAVQICYYSLHPAGPMVAPLYMRSLVKSATFRPRGWVSAGTAVWSIYFNSFPRLASKPSDVGYFGVTKSTCLTWGHLRSVPDTSTVAK